MTRFKEVPSIGVVTLTDATKAYAFVTDRFKNEIVNIHQATMFDHDNGNLFFNMTVFELREKRMIELGNGYAEVFYTKPLRDWACALLKHLATLKMETILAEAKASTVIGFARAFEMN